MYLNTLNKAECCGCSACQQICSHNAIEMRPDKEGFIFPVKDLSACVNCGLCEKVCSFCSPQYKNSTLGVYAAMEKSESLRSQSSSGGLFFAIAKSIVDRGGIVFGAYMNDEMKVYHTSAENINELKGLRGSKYVQSNLYDTYREIRTQLRSGRLVFFTGTGCQVAGLKSFLIKKYDNLITSDLVCHGVPNQKLFNEHIGYLEHRFKGKVVSYMFRDNKNWGGCESVKILKNRGHYKIYNFPGYSLSPYLYSFMHGMTFRLSCYHCPFAKIPRQGDITLADYWGVAKYFPELNSKSGVSLILINTPRGKEIISEIQNDIIIKKSNIKDASKENKNLVESSVMPEIRSRIFHLIEAQGYSKIANTIFRPKNYNLLLLKIKIKRIYRSKFCKIIKRQ